MTPGQFLDSVGIDVIASMLENGLSMPQVAARLGVVKETLRDWCARTDARSARTRAAYAAGAEWWEEQARQVLDEALDVARQNPTIASAVIALAREKAQACWRSAAVRDPGRYDARRGGGDVNVNLGVQVNGVTQPARRLSNAELVRIAMSGAKDGEQPLTVDAESGRLLNAPGSDPPPGPPCVDGAAGPIRAGAPSPDLPHRSAAARKRSAAANIVDSRPAPQPTNSRKPGAS